MKAYCENPFCNNRSVREVPASVDASSDQVRSVCATCEETYAWGAQHGKMTVHQAGKQSWKAVPYNDETELANRFAVATIVDGEDNIVADVFSKEAAMIIEAAPGLSGKLAQCEKDYQYLKDVLKEIEIKARDY